MTTTTDPDKFEEQWKDFIDELKPIGLSLPPEDISELNESIEDLKELVEVAAENMDDNDGD